MAPQDLDRLIEKYLEGKCTKEEIELIDSWYAALGKDGHSPAERAPDLSGAGFRILSHVQTHANDSIDDRYGNVPGDGRWRYAGIAASVIFILAAGVYFLRQPLVPEPVVEAVPVPSSLIAVDNTSEVRKRVILPDGSIVHVSPGSSIRYSSDMHSAVRELHLDGEAYFDVAHDSSRPFLVYAGNIVTRVLGTSFIVRAIDSDEKVTVSVKTGKVTVYTRDATHKQTVLVPNQEVVYDRRTDIMATVPAPLEKMASDGQHFTEMHFEEAPVSKVLDRLKETYDIDIVFSEDSLDGCVLTSRFYEEGLYDRIDVICTAIGATYKIVDSEIIIESYGCNTKLK